MTVNMPVQAMNEKCLNCPELELDVFTKEKYNMKKVSEVRTVSTISGFENVIKCKNWDPTNETCPIICRCQAIMNSVMEKVAEAIVNETKTAKKTTARKTTKRAEKK